MESIITTLIYDMEPLIYNSNLGHSTFKGWKTNPNQPINKLLTFF